MADKISIQDLTRQELIVGTTRFTDPSGNLGYSNDSLQVSALVRIADALEAQVELARTQRPGFTVEQWDDGLNHFHAVQVKGERLVRMDVLATSPAMAQELTKNIAAVLNAAIQVANQQEGNQENV